MANVKIKKKDKINHQAGIGRTTMRMISIMITRMSMIVMSYDAM